MEALHLKVLSYNIHKGFGIGRKKFILIKMREALRSIHPDLVFLQEVQGHHELHRKTISEWPTEPQFEYLADELWPHYAYGKNAVYSSGHHGNAILSKYPFIFYENIDVSTNKLEQRGLLHGVIKVPHKRKPIHVICVHLGLFESERAAQIQQLCKRINTHVPQDEPLIIAGDFNDWRVRVSKLLESQLDVKEAFYCMQGSHARTFPSWLPSLKLDRIYCRKLRIKSAQCLTSHPWNDLSDHAALISELIV